MLSPKGRIPVEGAGGDKQGKRLRYAGRVLLGLYVLFAVIGGLNLFGTTFSQELFVGISTGCILLWVTLQVQEFVGTGELGEKLAELRNETQSIRLAIERVEQHFEDIAKSVDFESGAKIPGTADLSEREESRMTVANAPTKPDTHVERQRLESEGVPILVDLIIHQDTITWTALSVFLAGQVILSGLAFQFRVPFLAILGFALTWASGFVLWRSEGYLEEYFELAKERVHPQDFRLFEVRVPGMSTYLVLLVLHVVLGIFWVGLLSVLWPA